MPVITAHLDQEQVEKADRIARTLSAQIGFDVSRSAVIRRAIDSLFLAVCLVEMTDDTKERQPADVAA